MVLYTPDEMLEMGLLQAGFDANRQGRVKMETNVRRFTSHYGSSPLVCAAIWEDLLTTTIPDARISQRMDPANFFLGMYYLKEYPTEEKIAGTVFYCLFLLLRWRQSKIVKIITVRCVEPHNLEAEFIRSNHGQCSGRNRLDRYN